MTELSLLWRGMGGARNVGVKPHIQEKYEKVEELMRAEPDLALQSVLERFNLPVSTYYRLRDKYDTKRVRAVDGQGLPRANEITLESIAGGIANELFSVELKKIAANISDPAARKEHKRTITMTYELLPDKSGEEISVFVTAESKLAPIKNKVKSIWCGKVNGEHKIVDQNVNQLSLFSQEREE